MYVAVRQDLSHPQQVVQACHAVIETVSQTPPDTHPNVIVCAVRDEQGLLDLARRLSREGVALRMFREPDRGGERTALATEVVCGERRRAFRALQLLGANQRRTEMPEKGQAEIGTDAHKTRWGYVAYSYDEYLKLKRLHAIYFRALRAAAQWGRWARKAPHNRVRRRALRDAAGRRIGSAAAGPLPEPPVCGAFCRKPTGADLGQVARRFAGWTTDRGVVEEYRKARRPAASPEGVRPRGMSGREIDGLLAEAEGWLASL